jgi:hypothetical protein
MCVTARVPGARSDESKWQAVGWLRSASPATTGTWGLCAHKHVVLVACMAAVQCHVSSPCQQSMSAVHVSSAVLISMYVPCDPWVYERGAWVRPCSHWLMGASLFSLAVLGCSISSL